MPIYAPCVDCGCYPCACPQDTRCSGCNRKACTCAQIEINGLGGYRFTNQCLTCFTTPCVCSSESASNDDPTICSECGHYECYCDCCYANPILDSFICSECGAMSCLCEQEKKEAEENMEYLRSLFRQDDGVCSECWKYKEIIKILLGD